MLKHNAVVNLVNIVVWAVLALAVFPLSALADNELYQAKTIVTGQREESRIPGFSKCLQDVLVKLSGDPTLLDDPKAEGVVARAPEYVGVFRYHDRLEALPVHDEQGSRDRPYDLTVDFVPEKVDQALRSLGREPWTGSRPMLLMVLAVQNDNITYMLASDGEHGIDQRESLAAAAWQMGMPLRLPEERALKTRGLSFETLSSAKAADLKSLAGANKDEVPLAGRLVWSKGTLGWKADWQLAWGGKTYQWTIKDVNFDDAFRSAVRGAAQILSGHGAPR